MMALLFGIVDVSMVVFMRSMLQNSVRESVRFAITYNTTYKGQNCPNQTSCATDVVKDYSFGFLNGNVGGQPAANYIKVYYYAKDNLTAPLTAGQLPKTLADGTVIQYLNQTGNLVEVRIENYPWSWIVPLPLKYLNGTGLTMTIAATDVMQGYPVGSFAPPIAP